MPAIGMNPRQMETSTELRHEELQQPPFNATFVGAVVGAARHYASSISASDFFCESGFAFAINMHPETCPSAPYCWNHTSVLDCLRNLGISATHIPLQYPDGTTASASNVEEQARRAASEAILSVEGLEHQLVTGCDDEQFKFALPWGPDVPSCMTNVLYKDLYGDNPPVFGFYRFDQCDSVAKQSRIIEGLKCALSMYQQPSQFQMDGYTFGTSAYKNWITALESGNYEKQGHWWNAMVWAECRSHAAEYFKNWPQDPKNETIELSTLYSQVSELLAQASDNQLEDAEKARLIGQASELEQCVPPLLQKVIEGIGVEVSR